MVCIQVCEKETFRLIQMLTNVKMWLLTYFNRKSLVGKEKSRIFAATILS